MDWSKFFDSLERDAGSDVMGQDSNALRYAKAERIFTAQLRPRRANRDVPATWRSGSWIHVANEAAMYGTRRASRSFQEHMKWILGVAGDAAIKVCHQVYHCLGVDSMAAIHGDDIIAEGEPEELNRLDEVMKRLVVVKSA